MEYNELIKSRESIRNYDPNRPIDRETLDKILEAGRLAPSAKNNQPWKFLVISSAEMREKVGLCYQRDWFHNAPHILIVTGNRQEAWVRSYDGYNSVETDLAITMTHMILAAENEGVGTCWIAAFDPDILRKVLNLNKNQVVFSITPLGYPRAGFRKEEIKIRKSLNDIVLYL